MTNEIAIATTAGTSIFDTFKLLAENKGSSVFIKSIDIKQALMSLSGIISKQPIIPITECVLIDIQDGYIKLTGTNNLEIFCTISIECETKSKGKFCIPFAPLYNYLKGLEHNSNILMQFYELTLNISRDLSSFKLPLMEASEFPQIPNVSKLETLLNVPSNYFYNRCKLIQGYCSNDELRPVFTGVKFELSKSILKFVATDAHKLAISTLRNNNNNSYEYINKNEISFIIKENSLKPLFNLLKKENGILKIKANNDFNNVLFSFGSIEYIVNTIMDEKYPDYSSIIPKGNDKILKVNTKECMKVINRVAQSSHKVAFSLNGVCNISSVDPDSGIENSEFVKDFTYNGDPLNIMFNGKYLSEILKGIDTEKIFISLSESNKACLIMPEEISKQGDFVSLLMPIMEQ